MALLFQPHKLLAFDIRSKSPAALEQFLDQQRLRERVSVHPDVDQSDDGALRKCLRDNDISRLDMVVDDASHLLIPTLVSFNLLFPLLRAGGLYVIEDWSCQIEMSAGLTRVLQDEPNGHMADNMRALEKTRGPNAKDQVPLAKLALLLSLLAAERPDVVEEVRLRQGWMEVRRGAAALPDSFDVARAVSPLSRRMLASTDPGFYQDLFDQVLAARP